MRLNLGCGSKKIPDWINVDKFATAATDQVLDLEQFPWPWPDDSVDEVAMHHVLEHLGADTAVYLEIIKELYRVCRDGAKIVIAVPHPRHDTFLGDPTHVRAIVPESLQLFSQAANREWIAQGFANTPLGLYIGVDFVIHSTNLRLEHPWTDQFERKEITLAQVQHAMRTYNNVVKQIDIVISPVKPAGRTSSPDANAA
jgi:SAM-dependent methyltransferase